MNDILKNVANNMLELGLGALTHANRHAAYQDPVNDKWGELSVLQAAHAAEILIKARIAQEHPLLIFDKFPKILNAEISLQDLFEDGRTIEWSELPNRLWATTGERLDNVCLFNKFGKIRNGIQHFGDVPDQISPSLETLKFIYGVIDPFINKCWGYYAIDFDEDLDSYIYFLQTLISYEIKFLVSEEAAKCSNDWSDYLQNASIEYRCLMEKRIIKALEEKII
jgi:hypothetical protein